MSNLVPGDRFFEFARGHSHTPLSDDQKKILDFGKRWFPSIGHRENAILEEFGVPSHVYFQKLMGLRDHPEASAYAPDVVNRMNSHADKQDLKRRAFGVDRINRG